MEFRNVEYNTVVGKIRDTRLLGIIAYRTCIDTTDCAFATLQRSHTYNVSLIQMTEILQRHGTIS